MTGSTPPYRAEHIGSLLRPQNLIDARDAFDAGKLSREELTETENAAIADVVKYQEGLGLKVVTDGEYRRISYFVDFVNGLDGVEATARGQSGWDYNSADGSGTKVQATRIDITGKIGWPEGGILLDDFAYLKSVAADGSTPKMTMPAPNQIYWFGGPDSVDRTVYPDMDEYWSDLVAAYRAEIAALAKAGCTYIQIDETCLPKISDPNMQKVLADRGDDWEELVGRFADTARAVAENPPPGVTVALHHCRGNSRGHWQAEGSYEMVADRMFNEIPAAAHFLEYDSPRAGDFSPLRFVPGNKTIVLGLVSTKLREQETADDLKRRIDEASQYVPLDRLCLSPQCGFSSSHSGHPLTHDDQKRKFETIIAVAHDVWGDA
jgi:5-methyltetrahydropteroyltriglutamate--homocysteine methyltransferase